MIGKNTKIEKSLYDEFIKDNIYFNKLEELQKEIKNRINSEEIKKLKESGTTIILIKYKDGYLLGSDRKSTEYLFTHSLDEEKIYPIGENFLVACTGLIAEIALVVNILKSFRNWYKNKYEEDPDALILSNFLYWISPYLWYSAYLVCGVANLYSEKKVVGYEISLLYKRFVENYAAEGSGAIFGQAKGVLEADYRKNLDKENAIKLMIKALETARRLDHYSDVRKLEEFTIFDVREDKIEKIDIRKYVEEEEKK